MMKMISPGREFTLKSDITGRTYFGPSMQKCREAEYIDRHYLGSTVWPVLLEVWDRLIIEPQPALLVKLDLDEPAWSTATLKDLVGTEVQA